tara:strand:- start:361 stop:1086 length:726 start_codon:yes stop_codon:yes gene_type:complete
MKLIREEIETAKVLVEEKDGKKHMYIEGTFLQGNLKNRNGRFYPTEVLEKEVNRYCESFVAKGRALGGLGHPDGPTVNLDRVSHKIVDLHREGNNFVGKAKLLETPMGVIAKNLLDEGVQLGVSSRGMGSLRDTNEGYKVVGEDFMLATAADIVADPSAPDAFVNGIMEGVEWVWDAGLLKATKASMVEEVETSAPVAVVEPEKVVEKAIEETQETINKFVSQGQLDEKKLEIFQNFLSNL